MRQYFKIFFYFSLLSLPGFSLGNNSFANEKKVSPFMTETFELICKQKEGTYIYPESIKFSDDGSSITYVQKLSEQNQMAVCVNGECGVMWDMISADTPVVAPKTNRIAYIGHKNGKVCLVLDGKKGEFFDTINDIQFSKNGKHLVFWGERHKKVFVVLNNKKSIQIDAISDLKFSPDGKKIVFSGKKGDKWYAFINGKKSVPYEWITNIQISPDSKHIAYFAQKKPLQLYTVLDGKLLQPWGARLGILQFSEDSSMLAYSYCNASLEEKKVKEQWHMSVDGKTGPEISVHSLFTFSPDSKHYAYIVGKNFGEQYIYENGIKGDQSYPLITNMKFSYDGKHFVFMVQRKKDNIPESYIVYNGKKHPTFINTSVPIFSIDSSLMLYKAVIDKDTRKMVVNGNLENGFASIGIPFFSPDGKRYGYAGWDGDEWQVIIDGKKENKYPKVGSADFDKSSQHYAYTAMKKGKWLFVVDGHEGQFRFDRNLPNSYIYALKPNHFKLPVIRMNGENPEFYWLNVKINE